jgi:hypothetical protein
MRRQRERECEDRGNGKRGECEDRKKECEDRQRNAKRGECEEVKNRRNSFINNL